LHQLMGLLKQRLIGVDGYEFQIVPALPLLG